MKRFGAGALVALAVPAVLLLLASLALALALAMGWGLSRLAPFDLFEATLLCLVALFGAGLGLGRGVAAGFGFFAARAGQRTRANDPAPRAPAVATPPDPTVLEPEAPRRRSRFDA